MWSPDGKLSDADGHVYRQGFGGWTRTWEQDRLTVKRDLAGSPVEAQSWGTTIHGTDGRRLYQPVSQFGEGAGAFLGLLLTIGLVILAIYLIGAILALLWQGIAAVFNGWRGLVERHPRWMLFLHVLALMIAVYWLLDVAQFGPTARLEAAAT